MRIDAIELRIIDLPFVSPFKTSFGSQETKTSIIVTVRSEGVEGYGESTMDPLPTYREETIEGALTVLRGRMVPWLLANDVEHPSVLLDSWADTRGNPMAKACIELAVWDCWARQQGLPLREVLGGDRTEIPVGASLGMTSLAGTLDSVERHVAQGYKRVKLKIEPGWDVELLTAVRDRFPDIELTVDANSAYTLDDVDLLRSLDQFGLHYIEQPLNYDDLTDHAVLAKQIETPLCLDESLTSVARTRAALDLGACSVVNVKVGRVGGLESVRRIHALCTDRGVPMWCGGMLETGIGRAMNLALAGLPNFTITGDVSASERFWKKDIVTEPIRLENGQVRLPQGSGTGVQIDHAFLNDVSTSTTTLRP